MLPIGFQYSGATGGIKESGKPDIAIISSDVPAVAAGVYTQNIVRAASIDWNRKITPTDGFKAVVVNSGNANACTGNVGHENNQQMATLTANALAAAPENICVMSTGVIGHQLPMDCVETGIATAAQNLGSQLADFEAASQAILTTDQGNKTAFRSFEIQGKTIRLAGMAKGAGMIGPNMATMLGIVTTDAKLSAADAQKVLQHAADHSFNCISVEGHTSTNDSLVLMANGQSEALLQDEESIQLFSNQLTELCIELATQIPADGEGATHLIQINVSGAGSDADADTVARAVAMSNLVKTAIAGADPNWGRITSATGLTSVQFDISELSVSINGTSIFAAGQPVEFGEKELSQNMASNFETLLDIQIGAGVGKATHWTSDLNEAYVKFNSEYTT